MSAISKIQWTDRTWNPVTGCTKVSPGCKNCYAEKVAERFWATQYPKNADGSARGFTDVRCHPERLDEPLRWRKPARVFVNSMSDLFHEDVPDEFILRVADTMAGAERHTFQVLTKRPERMRAHLVKFAPAKLLPNVQFGVSVENQATADRRVPALLATAAAVRFLSVEPMLEAIDLKLLFIGRETLTDMTIQKRALDWVIVGGESGPNARPCNVEWIRSIVWQCKAAGVPVFVKQLGAKIYGGMYYSEIESRETEDWWYMSDRKGGDISEWPEDLRVREFPGS